MNFELRILTHSPSHHPIHSLPSFLTNIEIKIWRTSDRGNEETIYQF